jgi:hypothetical protein
MGKNYVKDTHFAPEDLTYPDNVPEPQPLSTESLKNF